MKKTVFFLIILALLATGCKKKKSKDLNYNDSDPIEMVLRGNHQIQASSDYDISYSAINPNFTVIEVSNGGNIYGKNVGNAKVKIDNSYESRVIDVVVNLFKEPTFEFGCTSSRIRELYGRPFESGYLPGDTILCYRYTASNGYSYACGEMDFFFYNRRYYESDVYIRPKVEDLLDDYVNDNFNHTSDRFDTIVSPYTQVDTIIKTSYYRNKVNASLVCGITPSLNQWHEWVVFYYPSNPNSRDNDLKRLPRSSKLWY